MPIEVPSIDNRTWEQLRDELLARIPSHTPEWTNRGAADPGVTLLELFAFLGENILYRTNRIPERNRLAFLKLLGRPLLPGAPARALVTFERGGTGGISTVTLAGGLEVRAGKVAFHLDSGLDVLPVESLVCTKVAVPVSAAEEVEYRRLYATFLPAVSAPPISIYRTTPLGAEGVTFGDQTTTIDGCVWIALLARRNDTDLTLVRGALAGRVLSLGHARAETFDGVDVAVRGATTGTGAVMKAEICTGTGETPDWVSLGVVQDAFGETGVTELLLPSADKLVAWPAPEVLQTGVGEVPPALENDADNDRLVAWIRLSPVGDAKVPLAWIGINAAMVTQGDRIWSESVGTGNATPEQRFPLSKAPVVPDSLRVWVADAEWSIVPDVGVAPREGAAGCLVASVDWEKGELAFGSGLNGARPPRDAAIRVSYEVCAGVAGNVGAGSISSVGVTSVKVKNPLPAWGGTAPETAAEGEAQVARWLQHNDRLVTTDDYLTLTKRTPGVDLARVEVLPAFHPRAGTTAPGDAPGCVTLMVIPPARVTGEAPRPTDATLDRICAWLEPRRLITTELFLRGPTYKDVVVSVGVRVAPGLGGGSAAEIREAVRQAVVDALSPVPGARGAGWPLGRAVRRAELLVVVASVPGVQAVEQVLLAVPGGAAQEEVTISGLELPWLAAVAVAEGLPTPLSTLFTHAASSASAALPLPAVPERCG